VYLHHLGWCSRIAGKPLRAGAHSEQSWVQRFAITYGRTRQDVRDKLRKARERLDAGAPVKDATRTSRTG